MRAWEIPFFFGTALAAHVAAFLVTAETGGEAAPGGAGGDAPVTVAAASPEVAALVEEWEAPPQIPEMAPSSVAAPAPPAPPEPPRPAAAPSPAALPAPPVPALTDAPMAAPMPPLEPMKLERAPDPDPEPRTAIAISARPAPRPERLVRAPEPVERAPEPQPPAEALAAQRAAGPVGNAARGGAGQAQVATPSPGERANLVQIWGARIGERLQRALLYPWQAQMRGITGRAIVELTVGTDGGVRARRLAGSSGSELLDEAALSTVDRAGGLPPAPAGLSGSSFTFQLPVVFQAR